MKRIHLIQCLCPERHAIMAVMYDPERISAEGALAGFQQVVELALQQKVIRQRCEICKRDVEFHYEDAVTKFNSIEEAAPLARQIEAQQLATRRFFDAARN